ncbi:hypothetical protein RFI_25054 [Reticulomyxa filosa]|uniref:Tudor domain-containing protein n=1 Tax=Reticulomyxa filosa TaxID=46433 RepID=X6MFX1_RETFI|nr:hypothetical protein RFI_25054 [Reticulomyxa filosa]|eukprot:ETO12322.1 hypothetical protein RFI_25054 [Reticulomyxa filosa]
MAYLELQRAEEKAKKERKGMYGDRQPQEIMDYSTSTSDISPSVVIQLQNYMKQQRRRAVVEHVFNGQRMKIYVPEQNCFLCLALAHIRCDPFNVTTAKLQTKFGRAAYEYLKHRSLQRNIEVEVTTIADQKDRNCVWMGQVWIDDKDLALEMLEKGLVKLAMPTGPRRANSLPTTVPSAYVQAEAMAKEQQIGLWEEIARKEHERDEQKKKHDMTGKEKTVVVSQIDTGVQFWVNSNSSVNELEMLEEKMSRIPSVHPGKIAPGKIVAALYDGLYCRAKVAKQDSRNERMWFVIFVDYGNRASVPERNITLLPQELSLAQWPQLAQRCQLTALRAPSRNTEHFYVAGEYFAQLVLPSSDHNNTPFVKELKIKILWDDYASRKWHVILIDERTNTNINEQMLREGHARFDHKGKETPSPLFTLEDEYTKNYLITAKKLCEEALAARIGLWRLGDVSSDEGDY